MNKFNIFKLRLWEAYFLIDYFFKDFNVPKVVIAQHL